MAEIKTKKGEVVVIDDEDFERASVFNWWIDSQGYVRTKKSIDGASRVIKLHRFLLGVADPSIYVDHISGDKKDNRKGNLRLCVQAQNTRNAKVKASSATQIKGVRWKPRNKKYEAKICIDRKAKYLGLYDTAEEAHEVYCLWADMLHREFARHA